MSELVFVVSGSQAPDEGVDFCLEYLHGAHYTTRCVCVQEFSKLWIF